MVSILLVEDIQPQISRSVSTVRQIRAFARRSGRDDETGEPVPCQVCAGRTYVRTTAAANTLVIGGAWKAPLLRLISATGNKPRGIDEIHGGDAGNLFHTSSRRETFSASASVPRKVVDIRYPGLV